MIKKTFFLILLGFFLSTIINLYYIENFDRYEISTDKRERHSLIKGVNENHWRHAKVIKEQLKNGEKYFDTGQIYNRNYLPSKILLIYSFLSDDEMVEEDTKKITTDKKKLSFLIFQSVLYFSILFFFSKELSKRFTHRAVFFVVAFLAIEPTLNHWHSSFWSESIFLSLQLLLLTILIKKQFNTFEFFLSGIILGLMFLQRSATIYYFFPLIIFLFFVTETQKVKKITIFVISYLLLILFVGYHQFKRADVFYVAPTDQKFAVNLFLLPHVMSKVEGIPVIEAQNKIDQNLENWKKDNQIDVTNEKSLLKFYDYIQSYSYKYIFFHPFETTKFILKKSLHTAVLDPVHVMYFHKFEYKGKNRYLKSPEHQFWIPIRIVYSLIIYFVILIGLFVLLKKDKKIFLMTFISALYFFFILSWLGNPRYLTPCLIYLSIFFGFGLDRLVEILSHKKA